MAVKLRDQLRRITHVNVFGPKLREDRRVLENWSPVPLIIHCMDGICKTANTAQHLILRSFPA